jgi:hypothetical protein
MVFQALLAQSKPGALAARKPTLRSLRNLVLFGTVAGLGVSLGACGGTTTLNGAGASFPAAIYQRWFKDLADKGVRVNYQSVGSGAGVRQFISRTVDFAASDVPMKAEEIAKRFGEKVSYRGMTVEQANEVNAELADFYENHPNAPRLYVIKSHKFSGRFNKFFVVTDALRPLL